MAVVERVSAIRALGAPVLALTLAIAPVPSVFAQANAEGEGAAQAAAGADPQAAGPGDVQPLEEPFAEVPVTAPARATPPPPGTKISSKNVDEFADFFSPGMRWAVDRGVTVRVGSYQRYEFPPPVQEATEQYSGQVAMSEDGEHIVNYVAGIPFPVVAGDDPHRAIKLMYNYDAAIQYDDVEVRNFDCQTGVLGRDGRPVHVERQFLVEHFRRLYFTGRLETEPKPELLPNKDESRYKESLYPLIEPFDLKGAGTVFIRHIDFHRHDDSWLYLPQIRRVRRLSSAQRSDALFGQDVDPDSYGGYSGNIAWMEWSVLGEKTEMASLHSEHMPVVWGQPPGDFMHSDEWEPREVYVLEGRTKLPQYAYSKRVIYLDKEALIVSHQDIYDQAGQLWKLAFNQYKHGRKPIADAEYVAPFSRRYFVSTGMLDMQLDHVTFCALPSHRLPTEQGWYINVGEIEGTVEDAFEVSTMIAAGR